MKKLLLSALAVCAFTFSNAQEEKTEGTGGFAQGDMMISGAFSFGSESTGDFKTNTFTVSPKAGYFVSDNIAVGVALGYENTKWDNGSDDVKNSELSVGAFARYYMTPAAKFSLFAQLGVDYMSYDNEIDVDTMTAAETKGNGFGVKVAPGVSYFISDAFALEASWGMLGYETTKPDFDGAESTDTFGLGLDMRDLSLGLVYKF